MATYRNAVDWIARNDEPGETNPETVATMIATLLVADLWGKEPEEVGRAIVRRRRDLEKKGLL